MPSIPKAQFPRPGPAAACDLLILPDGTVLAHNLTPAVAQILKALNPADEAMLERARSAAAEPDLARGLEHLQPDTAGPDSRVRPGDTGRASAEGSPSAAEGT